MVAAAQGGSTTYFLDAPKRMRANLNRDDLRPQP